MMNTAMSTPTGGEKTSLSSSASPSSSSDPVLQSWKSSAVSSLAQSALASVASGTGTFQALPPKPLSSTHATTTTLGGTSTSTAGPSQAANTSLTLEEQRIAKETHLRFVKRLAQDHAAVLNPSTKSFTDAVDVINRLLPFHIYHYPAEDFPSTTSIKGKEKALNVLLAEEINETKFALECYGRRRKLQKRFLEIRIREGQRAAPADQALFLAQSILDSEREDSAAMNAELKVAKAELEKLERAKKPTQTKQATVPASTTKATTTPTTTAAATTPHASYTYRGYPYTYTQPYTAYQTIYPYPTMAYAPVTQPAPIPVQLPVGMLPTLTALGITPVAAPSAGQPTPAAVLRSSNGTVVNLEINVGLLLPHQMSGLAALLNSLMAAGNSTQGSTRGTSSANETKPTGKNAEPTSASPTVKATTVDAD